MNRITLILATIAVSAAQLAAADPAKNIVLILADDLGWVDTTLYGKTSLYETPNIERLAARQDSFQCVCEPDLFADARRTSRSRAGH